MTLTIREAREVLEQIGEMYGVTADQIRSKRRKRPMPEARAVFALVMRHRGYSLAEIGYVFFMDTGCVAYILRDPPKRARYVADGMIRDEAARAAERAA